MTAALHHLTIAEAGARLRAGTLSSLELTRACLDRIAAVDDRLHAFITLTAEQALEEARQADAELRAGRSRGPLHGIPIAHKDMISTRGVRTTAHSNLLRDWIPEQDATVYTRLREAGAISLGKLSCWEFATGNPGPNVAFPPARNPWNVDYSPGGSSSGSGAAVSAGLCLGATGTDTGGSIRHPAAVCSIVGMKPTFGRVSVHGVLPLAASMDNVGPMTRTVRDNAIMLQTMAGRDPADPTSSTESVPDFQGRIGKDLRSLRLGVPRRFIDGKPHDPECTAAVEAALRILRELGAETVDFDLPTLARASELGSRIIVAEVYAYHKENLERFPEKYDVPLRERVLRMGPQAEAQLGENQAMRQALTREYAELFAGGIDAIVSPARENISDTMERVFSNPARLSSCTWMYNLANIPALALPMGFGKFGMPLGLQLAADRFAEDLLYQIGAAYEGATDWASRRPPI